VNIFPININLIQAVQILSVKIMQIWVEASINFDISFILYFDDYYSKHMAFLLLIETNGFYIGTFRKLNFCHTPCHSSLKYTINNLIVKSGSMSKSLSTISRSDSTGYNSIECVCLLVSYSLVKALEARCL